MFTALSIAALLGTGLVGGVFFAFSSFVMPALSRIGPREAIRSMQAINVAAVTPAFMTALFGSAVILLVLGWLSLGDLGDSAAGLTLAAGVSYLVGTVLVTIACNVPRNNELASISPDIDDRGAAWHRFLHGWTRWNHVRCFCAILAAGLLVGALITNGQA